MMAAFSSLRRLLLIEEHAIDAEADAEFFLKRLDVDVAGALLDGLRDHGVHQPDDGRFARHVAQVFEIVFIAAREIGCGRLAVAFGVIAVDGVENFLLGGELRGDFELRKALHRVDGFEVERVGHRQRQRAFVDGERETPATGEENAATSLRFRERRVAPRVGRWQARAVRKGGEQIALGQIAHVDEDLAELVAAFALQFEARDPDLPARSGRGRSAAGREVLPNPVSSFCSSNNGGHFSRRWHDGSRRPSASAS